MSFLPDRAIATLGSTLAELLSSWAEVDATTQEAVGAAVRRRGPVIAAQLSQRVAGSADAAIALLDDLWLLSARLPAGVLRALAAGRSDRAPIRPQPVVVSEAAATALVDALLRVADFRTYDRPAALARELVALVDAHRDRLCDEERAGWDGLCETHRAGGDDEDFLRAVDVLLGSYPRVRELLDRHLRLTRQAVQRGAGEGVPGPSGRLAPVAFGAGAHGEASTQAGVHVAPGGEAVGDALTRYANVHFPDKVLRQQARTPLVIHVAGNHDRASRLGADEAGMSLKPAPLTILARTDGFAVENGIGGREVAGTPAARTVEVRREGDCEPVVFFLTPLSVGVKRIAIDFYQFDRNIHTVAFSTEVVEVLGEGTGVAAAAVPATPIASPVRGAEAPAPELELRVMLSADAKTLSYTLHAPRSGDYHFKPVGQIRLEADPLTSLRPTFDRLSTLAAKSAGARTGDEALRASQELVDIGQNLYASFFPEELKREYSRFRERPAYLGRGLLITSDEPWVPWEMIRPYAFDEDGRELFMDEPLCERFQVSRWIAGRGTLDRLVLKQGVYVVPPDNLESTRVESGYFAELHRRRWDLSLDGPLSALAEVEQRFRDGAELYHFACHGNFNTDDPNESKLKLAGDFLRPSQIIGDRERGIRRARPIVFLNACYGGRVGVGVTHIGGWARRFIEVGASAFIGALWEVNDSLAARFASAFYDRLLGIGEAAAPLPLAQAFHEARMVIRREDPANPTWLAYVLYGDPYGEVLLGDRVDAR